MLAGIGDVIAVVLLLWIVAKAFMKNVPKAHEIDPTIDKELSEEWDGCGRIIIYAALLVVGLLVLL